MIRSRLSVLLAEKGHRENRKLTYRVVSEETGLSQGVLVRLNGDSLERVEIHTLEMLCDYFGCGVGDLLINMPSGMLIDAEESR